MIRSFFQLIFRFLLLAFLIVMITVVWIVYDGLNDHGEHADVGVVLGNAVRTDGMPGGILRNRLDRTVELYRAGKFPLIIVSGATKIGGYDEPNVMANYLIEHEVPRSTIIEDKMGATTDDTGLDAARIMRAHHLQSAMVVTNYYHITRAKLALQHAGIHDVEQAHVGVASTGDVAMVAREVVALYYYLGRYYLIPAAEKAREQAKVDAVKIQQEAKEDGQKAKEEANKMKDKANQRMDSLRK